MANVLSIMAGVAVPDASDNLANSSNPALRSLSQPNLGLPPLPVRRREPVRDQETSNAARLYIMELTTTGRTGEVIAERDRLSADPFYAARPGLLVEQVAANVRGRICLMCLEVLALTYGDDEAPVCGDCGDAAICGGRADICVGCGALSMIGTTWVTLDTPDCKCGGQRSHFLTDDDVE